MSSRGRLTTEQVAEMTGYSPYTVRNFRTKSNPDFPPYYKIGRKVFYQKSMVEAWIEEKESRLISGN